MQKHKPASILTIPPLVATTAQNPTCASCRCENFSSFGVASSDLKSKLQLYHRHQSVYLSDTRTHKRPCPHPVLLLLSKALNAHCQTRACGEREAKAKHGGKKTQNDGSGTPAEEKMVRVSIDPPTFDTIPFPLILGVPG